MTETSSKWNESDRLDALARYAILDTPIEANFDNVVKLVAATLHVPIAVINFIGDGRQWFKAEVGLGVRETPIDSSFCAQVILQPDGVVVPDATLDPRFNCNPLVTGEPGLRFYAGEILQTPDGLPIGTVCVLDTTPRPEGLSEYQRFFLRTMAEQVMAQLELRRVLEAERKTSQRLEELHEQLRNSVSRIAFDGASVGMAILDPQLRFQNINRALYDLFGYKLEELTTRTLLDIAAFDERDKVKSRLISLLAGEVSSFILSARFARRDGSPVWVKSSVSLVRDAEGKPANIVLLLENITNEVRAQQALRDNEERLHFALEGAGDGVWDWNIATNDVVFSKRWKAMLGFEPQELGDNYFTWRDLVHSEDLNEAQKALEACLEGKTATFVSEYRMWHKKGQWVWMLARASVVKRDQEGKPLRMVGTITDITETKRLTEELQRSYELLSNLAEQAPGILYQFKQHSYGGYSLPYISSAVTDIYGIDKNEAMADVSRMFAIVHPEDIDALRESIITSALTLQPWNYIYRINTAARGIRTLQANSKPIKQPDGSIVWHGFITDVTAARG